VIELHRKIESLCQQLSFKIEKKNEGLILNHEHFSLYEATLNEKYNPVFQQMRQIINDKREEYTTFLNRQLQQNDERIKNEQQALEKLSLSLQSIQDCFKTELEHELMTIKVKEELQKRENEEEGAAPQEGDEAVNAARVDTYKINAFFTMLDDFENILKKNFCLFANYEDFSFA